MPLLELIVRNIVRYPQSATSTSIRYQPAIRYLLPWLQDRLNEERENLRLLQQTLEQERATRAHGGGAQERACDVNRRIIEDRAVEPPVFGRASQNVIAAAILLRNMLEPSNPEARRARDEIRGLLETTAMQ
jgi:tyrosyl-tRNA synthetase